MGFVAVLCYIIHFISHLWLQFSQRRDISAQLSCEFYYRGRRKRQSRSKPAIFIEGGNDNNTV